MPPYKIKIPRKSRPRKNDSVITLLDLPNELLISILSNFTILAPRDIFNAAQLSKRFRALALPLFLTHHGIPDPENEVSVYVIEWDSGHSLTARCPDALAGLNLTTYISRVNRFRCFFQDPDSKSLRNTFQKAFDLPEAVRRVCRFVNRLEGITTAEVYLIWDPYFTTRERHINYVPWNELKRWTRTFGHMLNLLVERGCSSLTVQYEASILPPFQFRSTNRVKKAFSYLSQNVLRLESLSSDLHWEFERSLQEDKSLAQEPDPMALLSPSAQAINSVTSLSIHSPVLLLPPFVNWTLSLLRTHSNLTSISFAYISFPKDMWSTILPFVAEAVSHRLTKLSFYKNCPHLETIDLLQFIKNFPNLTQLSIDRSFRSRFQELKPQKSLFSQSSPALLSRLRFPNLHTLQCPVELASLLLGPRNIVIPDVASIPLPSLKHLTVYPCSLLIHPPSYVHSSVVITDLINQVKSQPRREEVIFSLDAQMEFKDFGPVARYIETLNSQQAFHRTLWDTLDEADIQKLEERGSDLPPISFEHVVHVVLYRFVVQTPDHTPASLCLWLNKLFPNVERLTFTCRLDAHPQEDFHMNEKTIQWIMKELQSSCPKVRTLIVGEKVYTL